MRYQLTFVALTLAASAICASVSAQEPRRDLKIETPKLIAEFPTRHARGYSPARIWKLEHFLPAGMDLVEQVRKGEFGSFSGWESCDYDALAPMLPAAIPGALEND